MLVRSLIYGWGFDFMRPFQKRSPLMRGDLFTFYFKQYDPQPFQDFAIKGYTI